MTARFTGGISSGLVYGDGEKLILDWFGEGCVVIDRPLVTSVEIEREMFSFDSHCGRQSLPGPASLTATIISGGPFAVHHGMKVPDLRQMAEKLSVAELFSVIEKKLAKRGGSIITP